MINNGKVTLPPPDIIYQLKEFIRRPTTSPDSILSSFMEYQNLRLLPIHSVETFKEKNQALLTRSMLSLCSDANLDILYQNAQIFLQPSSRSRIALIEGQVDESTGNQVEFYETSKSSYLLTIVLNGLKRSPLRTNQRSKRQRHFSPLLSPDFASQNTYYLESDLFQQTNGVVESSNKTNKELLRANIWNEVDCELHLDKSLFPICNGKSKTPVLEDQREQPDYQDISANTLNDSLKGGHM
ncbi:hypothetical protein RF11_16154 [Thelohanellus kitauei]|uniref:Uncharacterized protein n=1 Tax=Thelohanellus kitauei TaxID=669202 RepID=A0A0C2J7Q6_THEKT|nr:hypothetical protein RF11_16154 [Thelohanellus kitauei]